MNLGLTDLVQSGKTPDEAAVQMRLILTEPPVLAMLMDVAKSEVGQELLDEWAQEWRVYGFDPPWADLMWQRSNAIVDTE